MNILVVCESEKKARVHSRRIISKYLPQLGSQVWFGSISEEGAKELYKELSKKASKNMSVVCHRVTSRSTRSVYFYVGSKRYFDEKGYYAFSFRKENYNVELPKNDFITLLKLIGKLSGLLHDIGKSIQSFQEKIRGLRQTSIATDPIRHDLLSAIVVVNLIKKYKKYSEIEVLNIIKDYKKENWEDFIEGVFHKIGKNICNEHSKEQFVDDINIYLAKRQEWFCKFPILLSVTQVVIGHHFIPKADQDKDKLKFDKYIHGYNEDVHGETPFSVWGNPIWCEDRWHDSMCATLNEIIDHLSNNEDSMPEPSVFMLYNRLIVRPAFVAADQNISAVGKKKRYSKDDVDLVPFANPYDSQKLDGQMAQTLLDHHLDVARETQRNIRKIYAVWQGHHLDFVDKIPRKLKSIDLPKQFEWQKKAQDIGKKINGLVENPNFPFFGVMTASTGSGKTRCIPRFMSFLQGEGNVRFTLALGLRTLTEQSGRNYIDKNEVGFQGNQHVSVLIGGSFYDFADQEDNKELENSFEGIENESAKLVDIADEVYGGLEGTYIDPDSPFPRELAGPQGEDDWGGKGAKKAKMLQVPVLVCTIDHLMAGLINPKADAAKILPRLITSDLVIDEIDSFDIRDIQALMQLIFYTAAAGRKVVVSSATISPILCRALFHQYKLGYDFYIKTHPEALNTIYTAWINDIKDLCQYKKLSIDKDIVSRYQKETEKIFEEGIKLLDKKPVRRKLDFLDISDCKPEQINEDKHIQKAYFDISKKISYEIDNCHHYYHTTKDGKNLSVGIIRITYAKHAYQVFNKLFDIDSQIGAKRLFVFYQSRLEDENLKNVENLLNKLLKRTSNIPENDPIWEHEGVQKLIQENLNITDFQIIVVSTPIEEVGRDHDFDWGIVEPTSIWSIIQMAGRIFRHRPYLSLEAKDPANIIMLSHPFREILSSRKRAYEQPGPVDKYHLLSTLDAREVFPEEMKTVIDSRYVMKEHETQFLEGKQKYDTLSEVEQDRITHGLIDNIINSDIFSKNKTYLADYYNEMFPFRDSSGQVSVKLYHEEEHFSFKFYLGKKEFSGEIFDMPPPKLYDKSKLLLSQFGLEYISGGEAKLSLHINEKQLNNLRYAEKLRYAPEVGYVFV